jgi:hypothetical protein
MVIAEVAAGMLINLIGVYNFSGPYFNMWLSISTSTLPGELCSCD